MITLPVAWRRPAWVAWLLAALLLLALGNPTLYGVAVPVTAGLLALAAPPTSGVLGGARFDARDVVAVLALYGSIVGLFRLAFGVFTQDNTLGLFLCFATGLVLGVAGPVVYTVWLRGRPLADLGLSRSGWRPALALGVVLAAVQFALTLYGYPLPAPVDWVPLAALSLVVGLFEAVFFRGFVQTRLVAGFGALPGVGAAAALYALYHVGYGMGATEMLFLFGLGVLYAVAYACTPNVLVLWPLLLPLGSFFNNLEGGDIRMPWGAVLGFADVLGLMVAVIWLAHRHERRARTLPPRQVQGVASGSGRSARARVP